MKLLIRATNWVGDAVMSLPALRLIRRVKPHAEITVLARPWVADLYGREDFADHVLTEPRGRLAVVAQLRQRRFDCALLLPNSFDAALMAWLARIPSRIGYARDARRRLLTDAIPAPKRGQIPPHQSYYYLELLRRAGWIDHLPDVPGIRMLAHPTTGRQIFQRFGLRGERVLGVSPGAAFGSAKRWLPDRFATVAAELAGEWDTEVAIFGSASELSLCSQIAASIGPRARSLAGQTSLGEFIDLAAACMAFLTNDSGAMHIASAVGVPTVAVFGPTDAAATGPCGPLFRIVRTPVECSPCLLRECPIDHRCMTRVSVEKVKEETRGLVVLPTYGHAHQDH